MTQLHRTKLSLAVLAAAMVAESASAAVLEEVVVTARKRAETLAESPISVKAFTDSEIRAAGIQSPQDFVNLTPNVTLVQTQSTGNSFLNIRGVSSARNSELAAAVLIDGVLMSNPTQLNQQLFDIQQVEVLRGPQGALYGRNAIGGAITITTKKPSEETEGEIQIGYESAPGYSVKGYLGGSLSDDGSVTYRIAGSYQDHEGYLRNTYLKDEADPLTDTSFRARINWDVSDKLSTDFRVSYSKLETQAFYFVIGDEADNTSLDIMVNNPGNNEREFVSASFKLDYDLGFASLTAITAYDDVTEVSSGDQFNFLPREHPFNYFNNDAFGGFIKSLTGDALTDLSQNQYLEVESLSQEVRLTSNNEEGLRWIAGAYAIQTDRYISTGSQIDRGLGVFDVEKTFRDSVFVNPADPSPQLGILADGQDNFAWAVFGQLAYDLSDQLEANFSLRYDRDTRENTALTPAIYDVTGLGLVLGDKRKETWSAMQPKLTLRYRPSDDWVLYGDISRGFRSGGFNQTGVGVGVPVPGVDDLFDEQIADNYEVGAKGELLDGRLRISAALFRTDLEGAYFFLYDPGTNTQNLGSIGEVEYTGLELEGSALIGEYVTAFFGMGLTDSEIQRAADPSQVGNQAPLVSETTFNLGLQYRAPFAMGNNMEFFARADYQRLGKTWWEPNNDSYRSPVNTLDARVGIESTDNWSVTLWAKNATDKEYNTEYSPGPAPGFNFLWKAQPVRYGLEFTKWF